MLFLLGCSLFGLACGGTMQWRPTNAFNTSFINFNVWPLARVREYMICSTFCDSSHPCHQVYPKVTWNCASDRSPTPIRKSPIIGSRCRSDEECEGVMGAICFRKKCLCEPGLSFDQHNRCTRGCREYGTHFSVYKRLSNKGHNNIIKLNCNEQQCRDLCIAQTKFLCVSVEMGYKMMKMLTACHLSNVSYLDVPEADKCPDSAGYTFSTRNCKPTNIITCS